MKNKILLLMLIIFISGCSMNDSGTVDDVILTYDNLKLNTEISQNNHPFGYSWITNNKGMVEIGSEITMRKATVYGADCVGCYSKKDSSASTSAQILLSVNQVRQSNGKWLDGITYDGYYIVAMDSAIPLCTTIKITNHGYVGAGIQADQPFMAIVLDRGGLISGNAIDLFSGSESNSKVKVQSNTNTKVEIIEFNDLKSNSFDQKYCEVN